MKLLLRYGTTIGPRTVIAEIADRETAQAVRAAHQAAGEEAELVEEMPRISMKDHLIRHRKQIARASKLKTRILTNIIPIKRGKK